MPTPGDVDVVIAAEYMEAGRSMLRGLVTPDRTTLIASTHRALAVSEKETPGDGVADSGVVADAIGIAAKRTIAFDMQALAEANGTVISAALFGALAGSGSLRVRTDTICWFLLLAAWRRGRRGTLRHRREAEHRDAWLALARRLLPEQYDLAVEVLACRRLVKGYSDTHARGAAKFDRVIAALPALTGRPDAADWLRRLRQAALLDEDGVALEGALRTVATLAEVNRE